MRFKSNFLVNYIAMAPLALALERVMECRILSQRGFERPILDIGCGEGLFAAMLFAEKIDTGIDPNSRELERARELDAYDELINCRGDAIPKPDGHYRTILSNSVVEHIPDIEPVLREAHRLLAPGGRLYLTVPSDRFDRYTVVHSLLAGLGLSGLAARFSRFYNRFWAHYHYYTPERWQEIARGCGFEVAECHTYGPRGVCIANDALVPFSLLEFVTKRLANRWTLFPNIRRVVLKPVAWVAERMLRGAERARDGGLVFLALTRR